MPAKKKTGRKPASKERIAEAPFYCVDGSSIKTVKELAHALDTMSDDVFYYHVNQFKNDFATWVNDCFGDAELAKTMSEKATREHSLIAVLKRLVKG
ncbi:MAG: DUF5752 family protein [Nanoarchaeota archaeon]